MHQTTLRFTSDLWEALELECGRLGISAAQYLREAALARLSYTAGQRGDVEFERALVDAGAATATSDASHRRQDLEARAARADSSEPGSAAAAVSAQSEHVRRRSQEIRAQSAAMRRQREDRKREER